MNPPSIPLLSVSDLSTSFHGEHRETRVVDNISFTLGKGEMLAIVGESGSGKSVTALSILQLLPYPATHHPSGSITLGEEELLGANDRVMRTIRGRRIAMIFQEPMTALNPLHSIGRQIGEVLRLHKGLKGSAAEAEVKRLLDEVGLAKLHDRLDAYPHQLSGGERQRAMIAMAIAGDPEILIADEPTTAIDVTLQVQILALLKKLQAERGLAILLITHDLPLVRRVADRVAVMQKGRIVEQGAVSQVFADPQADYTQKLLASEPKGHAIPLASDAPETLACQNLTVAFAKTKNFWGRTTGATRAVDDVSFSLRAGETLGIVGESGSGKTTLALALLRLVKAEGKVEWSGDITSPLRGRDEAFCETENSSSVERSEGGDDLSDNSITVSPPPSVNARSAEPSPLKGEGVMLFSLPTREMRYLRRHMQIVFQDPFGSLNPRLTVGQIIGEGLAVHFPELTLAERDTRILEILQEVGLLEGSASDEEREASNAPSPLRGEGSALRAFTDGGGKSTASVLPPTLTLPHKGGGNLPATRNSQPAIILHRYPHEFSGGQRQRIAIARAMVLKPRLVILDEPTSALDLSVQAQIIALLKSLQQKYGLSYLFISHDLRVVRSLSHRVAVMKQGRLVEIGATEDIFERPRQDYTKNLITAALR